MKKLLIRARTINVAEHTESDLIIKINFKLLLYPLDVVVNNGEIKPTATIDIDEVRRKTKEALNYYTKIKKIIKKHIMNYQNINKNFVRYITTTPSTDSRATYIFFSAKDHYAKIEFRVGGISCDNSDDSDWVNEAERKILDAISSDVLPEDINFRVELTDIIVNDNKYKTFTEAEPHIKGGIDGILEYCLPDHILLELGIK